LSASERSGFGVYLTPADDAKPLKDLVNDIPVIACNFEGFMDGRPFSQARSIRDNFGFKGELRATGAFIRDQLCYLARCGFNSFEFADENFDLNNVLSSLSDFTESYQAASDVREPLFRRRA
jgi:uncharacterized protein (DUF934 family)